eukprot:g370.t1
MTSTASSEVFNASSFYDQTGPDETKTFIMQQTCFRIKDPKRSLDFYTKILGMKLLYHIDMPQYKFSNYFVGYSDVNPLPKDPKERSKLCFTTPGCIELTWNHGTETLDTDQVYNTGNASNVGTQDGKPVKGLAFIYDPDGYLIEVLPKGVFKTKEIDCNGIKLGEGGGYKDNSKE